MFLIYSFYVRSGNRAQEASMPTIAPDVLMPAEAAAAGVMSEEGLALLFSRACAERMRYVAAWNRWLLFDGVAWRPDETLRVAWEVRLIRRAAAVSLRDPGTRMRLGSAATVAAVERLLRSDARHAAAPEQWDADPWLLNTPVGTVDLRTGDMRPHRREDYITKVTAVAPGGDCPLFRGFLARIFAGDAALIGYVQRALGYALIGDLPEHALFFCYGTGGNGKSVLLNTVLGLLGGYGATAPMEGFIAARGEVRAAELAMLRGTRFVVAPESEQGEAWNERRIKALTGGDGMTARATNGAPALTCRPSFKLFFAGNHKPVIRSADEAIRRRLNIVPFDVTIPAAEADRELPRKLAAEWPGILAWMIAGCREWQRIGLAPPPAVAEATADHIAEQDTLGAWIAEWICAAPEGAVTMSDLFKSWVAYATAAREPPGTKRAFAEAIRSRGFAPCRIGKSGAAGYKGIRLELPAAADEMPVAVARAA